jgi:hypothetical protein
MSTSEAPSNRPDASESSTGFGCFLQLASGLGGFFFLVILTVLILRENSWTFTIKDVLFWIVVLCMIAAKHVEVTRLGSVLDGVQGSRSAAVLRYAVVLVGVAAVVWAGAQALNG